ncbi:hypothetical protein [Lacimicrobium alkaliphilum]|nr:hypothetical protein [Lacimicrobium alkaliphilum]
MKRNRLELPESKRDQSSKSLAKQVRQLGQELDRLLDEVLQNSKG